MSAKITLIAGLLLVAVGIGCVIVGFPDQTDTQKLLMDLSSVPFVVAVAIAVGQMTWETKALKWGGVGVGILYATAVACVLTGAALYIASFTTGPRTMVALASTFSFGGLGIVFCFLVVHAVAKEKRLRSQNHPDNGQKRHG